PRLLHHPIGDFTQLEVDGDGMLDAYELARVLELRDEIGESVSAMCHSERSRSLEESFRAKRGICCWHPREKQIPRFARDDIDYGLVPTWMAAMPSESSRHCTESNPASRMRAARFSALGKLATDRGR